MLTCKERQEKGRDTYINKLKAEGRFEDYKQRRNKRSMYRYKTKKRLSQQVLDYCSGKLKGTDNYMKGVIFKRGGKNE